MKFSNVIPVKSSNPSSYQAFPCRMWSLQSKLLAGINILDFNFASKPHKNQTSKINVQLYNS